MTNIPSYEQWKKDTSSRMHKRSEFLKKLDETLKPPQNRDKIKEALDRWIFDQKSQGKDWRKSVRNSKSAVTGLYRAVNDNRSLKPEELAAMEFIAREQKLALSKQFDGKQVTFKSGTLAGMYQKRAQGKMQALKAGASSMGVMGAKGHVSTAKGVYKNTKSLNEIAKTGKFATNAVGAADTESSIKKLVEELCPGLDPDKVLKGLGLGSTAQFASDVLPIIGLVSSGGKALAGWIGVAKTCYDRKGMKESRHAFAPDDPEAAFDAILVLLNREIASKTAAAGKATAAFTGKTLGFFCDANAVTGPVVGLMEVLATILQTIVEYVRDLKEVEHANQLLRVGYLNLDLFRVCPILGCYFLVVQDHSTIINMAVADYGSPQFVFDSERLIDKVRPTLNRARTYILESRFEIPNMEKAKGIATENWSVKGTWGKLTGLPGHVVDSLGEKIQEKRGKAPEKVTVDPSRIYGYGHINSGFGRQG